MLGSVAGDATRAATSRVTGCGMSTGTSQLGRPATTQSQNVSYLCTSTSRDSRNRGVTVPVGGAPETGCQGISKHRQGGDLTVDERTCCG